MRGLALLTVFTGAALAYGADPSRPERPAAHAPPVVASVDERADAVPAATLTEVVQRYCVTCHNDALLTGQLSLQAFDVEQAAGNPETAERMIRKLRAGMMPPPGMPRPSADTLLALVETIETKVDAAARAAPNLGGRRFQRLSRAEYERVVADLLGLDVDAGNWLPPDVLMGSFDNMAAAQAFSTTLLDSYMRAASEISRLAVGNANAISHTAKYSNPDEVSQHAWERVEGAPFGTRGGMVVTHDFPADGEYFFGVSTAFGTGTQLTNEDIDISIDDQPVAVLMLENNGGTLTALETEPIFVRAGQHKVSAAFIDLIDGPYEDRFVPTKWSTAGKEAFSLGTTGLTHLQELRITGPSNVTGVSETESRRRIFTCAPASAAEARPCARSIIERLASQAYRRTLNDEDLEGLMGLYDEVAAQDGFEIGIRSALQTILANPQFLFRLEREPEGSTAGQSYRLSDTDLATRLSFFLWASGPDQELLDVAAAGRLSDRSVLEAQVQRMLRDPRAESLATRFASQWLQLQEVGKVWPDGYLFPAFSAQLAQSMVRETQLFLHHLIQQDRSLLELFNADYTFLNQRLADHYGIEATFSGDEFKMVQYPNEQRRGILGHGSVLNLTSMSARTSPVIRGKWVMKVLMGTPPPPPPPNVPAFEASPAAASGRRLTTRERMEAHRKSPVCSSCHSFIDPIGLAIDNFDVDGTWRVRENMAPLDTRGTFYDGTAISTPSELVAVLLKRPIPLVRNFTENLMAYAIGRPVEYIDQPTIRAITRAAEANEYRMSSLIMGVVNSDVFQMRQTQVSANDQ
jgi:hypothetical protein